MATHHLIHLLNTDEHYACSEQQDVLRAMESLGRRGIPIGCRGGGCGICKVKVHAGAYAGRKMSRAFVSTAEEEEDGIVLACRVLPLSEMRLEAIDKLARCVERATTSGPPTKQSAPIHTRKTPTECAS